MSLEDFPAEPGADKDEALRHEPVMLQEVLHLLDPQPGETIVDCTLGGGGHAEVICRRIGQTGRLIGFEQDEDALKRARARLHDCPVTFVHDNFRNLGNRIEETSASGVDGVLFDLGVSSFLLDTPERGFSFRTDAPLDMRMDRRQPTTAADLVSRLSEEEMVRLFYEAGLGRWARRIARAISTSRNHSPIITTAQLAELVAASLPAAYRSKKIHPATQVFQALRIAVNDEITALDIALSAAARHCNIGARIVVIAFHSTEDREVKRTFQILAGKPAPPPTYFTEELPLSQGQFTILTKKPLVPSPEEVRRNPRSRSAKLRAVERIVADGHSPS
ncbi:MAG: 16S rRNA (cytosine(1402)-N(4))-methyltransferase RsmH [Armatimonadota bacterium]